MRSSLSLRARLTSFYYRHLYYPHAETTPVLIAAPLATACWFVVWGCRFIALAGGVVVMQAIRHHSMPPNAVAVLSLYCSALLAFSQFYHREFLKDYAPVVQKRLLGRSAKK